MVRIRHPYGYVLTLTYHLCGSLFVAITHCSPEPRIQVQAFQKLIYLKYLVPCLLLGSSHVRGQLDVYVDTIA